MKKYLMTILALASFGAAAGEVQLSCEGVVRDSYGNKYVTGNMILDEEAGEMQYARRGSQKYKKASGVVYTDEYVSGTISGDFRSTMSPIKIQLNRYTGIVTTNPVLGATATLQCEKVSREKLF